MADNFLTEAWLIIDAAGPSNLIGLIRDGQWQDKYVEDGDFLAMLHPATEKLLAKAGLELVDLAGAVYAGGPGSTLGLRLAAMFIRSLMEMPQLNHWKCLQYQNLELALSSIAKPNSREAVAPWRRDRFHHVGLASGNNTRYEHGFLSPADAEERQLPGFELGRRPPAFSNAIDWHPFPLEDVPSILAANPKLLQPVEAPLPYSAEEPDFARWTPRRHTKS